MVLVNDNNTNHNIWESIQILIESIEVFTWRLVLSPHNIVYYFQVLFQF